MAVYTDTIRRWATDLSRSGPLPDADGIGEVGLGENEAGRRLAVRFALRVREEVAEPVRFEVFGCGFTIAACAAAAIAAEGRSLGAILDITAEDIDVILGGLPPERGYCAELAVEALHGAASSARNLTRIVQTTWHDPLGEEHRSPGSADFPVYRLLMETPSPPGVAGEDRHLFACLLSAAARDPYEMGAGLGLAPKDLSAILEAYFPGIGIEDLELASVLPTGPPPEANPEVLGILFDHVPPNVGGPPGRTPEWLARIIAARAAHPGHLWVSMGLFERPELTAAIRRHLPTLAAANDKNMRWKRYLFKQVCDLHGAVLCKAPNCGVCSDYALCFSQD